MGLDYRKRQMQSSSEYRLLKGIYKAMDSYFLDPIIGFFIPGAGDIITFSLTIPFIYTSIIKIRSVSLTLSIIYNSLLDMLIGLIPVFGDIIDVFSRSYKKSYDQIVGYVENDPVVVSEIDDNALRTCILITVLCVVIRLVVLLLAGLFSWFKGLFS